MSAILEYFLNTESNRSTYTCKPTPVHLNIYIIFIFSRSESNLFTTGLTSKYFIS